MIGIIGILAAVAIPAYQSYTNQAKQGVTESALNTALRIVNLRQSQGKDTVATEINTLVKSKSTLVIFKAGSVTGGTPPVIADDEMIWCLESAAIIDGTNGIACIEQDGDITHVGVNNKTGVCAPTAGTCG